MIMPRSGRRSRPIRTRSLHRFNGCALRPMTLGPCAPASNRKWKCSNRRVKRSMSSSRRVRPLSMCRNMTRTVVYVRPVPGPVVATSFITFGVGIGVGALIVDNRPWGWGGWGWNWGARRAYYNHGYWNGWGNPYRPPHYSYHPRPIVWANRPATVATGAIVHPTIVRQLSCPSTRTPGKLSWPFRRGDHRLADGRQVNQRAGQAGPESTCQARQTRSAGKTCEPKSSEACAQSSVRAPGQAQTPNRPDRTSARSKSDRNQTPGKQRQANKPEKPINRPENRVPQVLEAEAWFRKPSRPVVEPANPPRSSPARNREETSRRVRINPRANLASRANPV